MPPDFKSDIARIELQRLRQTLEKAIDELIGTGHPDAFGIALEIGQQISGQLAEIAAVGARQEVRSHALAALRELDAEMGILMRDLDRVAVGRPGPFLH